MAKARDGAMTRKAARTLAGDVQHRIVQLGDSLDADARVALESHVADLRAALDADSGDAWRASAEALDALQAEALPAPAKGKLREYAESIGIAVVFALLLRSFVVEAFQIPSSSMVPTLLIGDHLFVSKYAFGVRIPFTTRYLVQWGEVERGDIVVFVFPVEEVQTQVDIGILTYHLEAYHRQNGGYPPSLDALTVLSPSERFDDWGQAFSYALVEDGYRLTSAGADGEMGTGDDLHNGNSAFVGGVGECLDRDSLTVGKDYIKRIIGLPGDRVSMRDRVLYINGQPIERNEQGDAAYRIRGVPAIAAEEALDSGARYGTYSAFAGMTSFDEIVVREDHVFVMGDNRDNSSDGRCWGQVPVENIKGSALFIFFSRDRSTGSIRWERFFDAVR
jgi:signal peptidase I